MESDYLKKIGSALILIALVVLSFFIIKPILMAVIFGLILAVIFSPIYARVFKVVKSKNFSAFLMCFLFAVIIIIPLWFLTPVLIKQSIQIFMASQQLDFVTPLREIFPALFVSETFSAEIGSVIFSFVNNITNSAMNLFSKLILNFPILFLELLVVFFVFFFALKDQEKFVSYIKSLLPFSKDIQKRLFKSSKDMTFSVLYGQILLGIIQGLIAGIAFFIVGLENALLLTILTALAGIFPIIGTSIVWIPVAIFLLFEGQVLPSIIVIFFGVITFIIENLLKPVFVAKRTNVHSSIILLGMVGGIFVFGLLGVVLGPLILAYLLILLEVYRNKKTPGLIIQGH